MVFRFDGPAYDVTYYVSMAGNLDGDGLIGESFIEPFDMATNSLGITPNNGTGDFDVSAAVAEVPIGSFTATADADVFRIGSVTYSPTVCTL